MNGGRSQPAHGRPRQGGSLQGVVLTVGFVAMAADPLVVRLSGPMGSASWMRMVGPVLAGALALGYAVFQVMRAVATGDVDALGETNPIVRTLSLTLASLVVGLVAGLDGNAVAWAGCAVVTPLMWWRYADRWRAIRVGWVPALWGEVAGLLLRGFAIPRVTLGAGAAATVAGMTAMWWLTRGGMAIHVLGRRVHLFDDPATVHVLGRRRSRVLVSRPDTNALGMGPTRSGKTRGLVISNVRAWNGGALVVASTKQDVLLATVAQRQAGGRVHLLDPLGAVADANLPTGIVRLRWTPLRGCTDWPTARARAASLMGAIRHGDIVEASHWSTQGERLLAPALHAAATSGDDMRKVMEWLAGAESLRKPMAILEEHEATEAVRMLRGVVTQDSRPRDSVIATVATAMHSYAGGVLDEAVAATDEDWDPLGFLDGHNTLYVVAPLDSEVEDAAPIVVGVLSELYGAVRAESDRLGGRLDLPCRWILDEVANISPLPKLPNWLSESAGRGLTMLLCAQDSSQFEDRWGRKNATTMWTNLGTKVIFPGLSNTETLRQLEALGGKHWIDHESSTSGNSGQRWGPSSQSESRTIGTVEVPRWPQSTIHSIPPGRCLVFRPDWDGPVLADQAR